MDLACKPNPYYRKKTRLARIREDKCKPKLHFIMIFSSSNKIWQHPLFAYAKWIKGELFYKDRKRAHHISLRYAPILHEKEKLNHET